MDVESRKPEEEEKKERLLKNEKNKGEKEKDVSGCKGENGVGVYMCVKGREGEGGRGSF